MRRAPTQNRRRSSGAESVRRVRASDTRVRSSAIPVRVLGSFACGYALGLLPAAELVARRLSRGEVDLQSAGTGNPGAMNAYRLLGRRAGIAIAVADVAKGLIASAAGAALAGGSGAHAAGVGAVAGHCYPLTRRFRGGMGAATSFGQCLATFPVFAPVDACLAFAVMRLPGLPRPAGTAVTVSSACWVGSGLVWWRRQLPNLWGPAPTRALPLANAATAAVIASRFLVHARRRARE